MRWNRFVGVLDIKLSSAHSVQQDLSSSADEWTLRTLFLIGWDFSWLSVNNLLHFPCQGQVHLQKDVTDDCLAEQYKIISCLPSELLMSHRYHWNINTFLSACKRSDNRTDSYETHDFNAYKWDRRGQGDLIWDFLWVQCIYEVQK